MQSHPEWVRGLKLSSVITIIQTNLSHPEWVRGLKLSYFVVKLLSNVAPRVGAWIETLFYLVLSS